MVNFEKPTFYDQKPQKNKNSGKKYFLSLLYMEFTTDYVTITKVEFDELLKIKTKYDALIKKSILFLTNNNIYCRLCNVLSKNNSNIENHVFKEEL